MGTYKHYKHCASRHLPGIFRPLSLVNPPKLTDLYPPYPDLTLPLLRVPPCGLGTVTTQCTSLLPSSHLSLPAVNHSTFWVWSIKANPGYKHHFDPAQTDIMVPLVLIVVLRSHFDSLDHRLIQRIRPLIDLLVNVILEGVYKVSLAY